jgi:hypothetical protein
MSDVRLFLNDERGDSDEEGEGQRRADHGKLGLSCFSAALCALLSGLPFKYSGAFPAEG